jgi:hypothetical protein
MAALRVSIEQDRFDETAKRLLAGRQRL